MKIYLLLITGYLMAIPLQAGTEGKVTQVCWLETSASVMDGALGGAGLQHTTVWNSTISAVLIRHAKGDLLLDTGLGPNAEAEMNELPAAGRDFGLQVVSGAKDRVPIAKLLTAAHEPSQGVSHIILTHTHYDHLGGATTLSSRIYIPKAEMQWDLDQASHPTITPPSIIGATKSRFDVISYDSGPYLSFEQSKDVYHDASVVIVPLPGHTPGSQGVVLQLGTQLVFFIGDAADTVEAAERGLPKSSPIRSATDFNPSEADQTTRRIADFHRAYPDIAIVPAHDRSAYLQLFSHPSTCIAHTSSGSHAGKVAQ